MPDLLVTAHAELTAWQPPDHQAAERARYLALLAAVGEGALFKELGDTHLTASTFVFSPDRGQVLLTLHRKARSWMQFGGHLERTDASLAAAGLREAREESGLSGLELDAHGIIELDRHLLGAGFSCREHWDVGFVAVADPAAGFEVSAESIDVAWWPVAELPGALPPRFAARLANALAQLQA